MTKISIIIPMYNEQRYIARCLESLSNQSYQDFEIILIDDGSKDDTVKIAKTFENKFNLTILQQKNSWPGKARNRWAKEAKWDIIILVDADMYFDKYFIEKLIEPIVNWEEIWTTHGVEKVWNPENIWAKTWCLDRIPNPQKRSGVYRAILRNVFLESGWFDSSRWYFDDNLSHINDSKWALTIMNAICYHNNPSTLKEAFKHSTRVGKSFAQNPDQIWEYMKKYKSFLIWLLVVIAVWIIVLCKINFRFINVVWILLWFIIVYLEYSAFIRMRKEKERRYVFSLPILTITRWMWYLYGMVKYLFMKK